MVDVWLSDPNARSCRCRRPGSMLILLCHKIKASSQTSAAWTRVEPGDQSDRKFVANGGNRVSRVALCAPDFPAQCNRRELQVSGVLRRFFLR